MSTTNNDSDSTSSKLIPALREGVEIIKMIFFKELRQSISQKHGMSDQTFNNMLTGAIINEVFGTHSNEQKFIDFLSDNKGVIQQELLAITKDLPQMAKLLTDALRIQTVCDQQENITDNNILLNADKLGIIIKDREMPMPSTFMAIVRTIGSQHNLIIPPTQITPDEDQKFTAN